MNLLQRALSALLPQKQKAPTTLPDTLNLRSYGQEESGLSLAEIQPVMEWIFLSLRESGCTTESHLFWLHPDQVVTEQLKRLYRKDEPVLGYRLGGRMAQAPGGLYWRMVTEHASTRIYQLSEAPDGLHWRMVTEHASTQIYQLAEREGE